MTNLELTDVPDGLVDSLRKEASAAGRNLNAEAIDCLRRGMLRRPRRRDEVAAMLEDLRLFRDSMGPHAKLDDDMIRKARDEGRE